MLVLSAALITHIINSLKGMAEKQKRLYLGSLAMTLGYGGVTALSKAVGISRGCIHRGIAAVKAGDIFNFGDRSRARGGGRKRIEVKHREAIIATIVKTTGFFRFDKVAVKAKKDRIVKQSRKLTGGVV